MATLGEARLTACKLHPYSASAILSLVPVESVGCPFPMAVDARWRLYYKPSELEKLTAKEAAAIVLHEVAHLLLKHHKRAKNILPEQPESDEWRRWNIATDISVNGSLLGEGLLLPYEKEIHTPARHTFAEGLASEAYYRLLVEAEQKQEKQACPRSSKSGENTGSTPKNSPVEAESSFNSTKEIPGESEDSGSTASRTSSTETSPPLTLPSNTSTTCAGSTSPDQQPQAPPPPGVDGGSCSDGIERPWEQGAVSDEAPGIQEHEAEQIIRKVVEKIAAANESRGFGKGGMGVWANDILHPKLDPRTKFMRAVRRAVEFTSGPGDYSYHRPSRRQSGEIIRPSNVTPIPRITLIVDTSGSMGERDIGLALGLVGKVLNSFRLRDGIKVVCWDDGLQSVGKVFSPKQIQLAGRGGTNMADAIKHAAEMQPRPELIVLCTDGETDYPAQSVGVPVIACLTREPRYYQVPSWIEKVALN